MAADIRINRQSANVANVTIKLKGWPALVVLVLLVVGPFAWSRYCFNKAAAELGEAREHLRIWILARETREVLPDNINDFTKGTRAEVEARAAELVRRTHIKIEDMQARCSLSGGFIFRVEYSVDGSPPEGRDPIEYYRLGYSPLTGWRLASIRRTFPIFWNIAPWRVAASSEQTPTQ